MPMAAVAVASAAYSAYSANKQAQQQSAAMGQQQGAANSQLALQQNFMNQQNSMYGPLMEQYVQQASGDKPLDYGLMSGQIQGNYDAAQRNLQGMLAARGMSASGLSGAGAQGLEIGRAGALANAFQTGMDRRRQLGLNVLQHYNPAANVQGVAGAYGNLQNMYGQYAGMYGNAAQQGYGAAASTLGNAAQMWQMGQAQPQGEGSLNPYGINEGGVQDPYAGMNGGQPMNAAMMQSPVMPNQWDTPYSGLGALNPSMFQSPQMPTAYGTAGPSVGYGLGATSTGAVQ